MPSVIALMRWVYVGRVSVATTIFVAASFYFAETPPGVIVTVAVAAVLSLIVTGASIFHTHIRGVVPGPNFLYAQNLFDLGLVTTVVHVTGGVNSDFASLYILIIAVSAVTMPIASSLLVTITAAVLYVADVVLMYPGQLSIALWLQVGVFVAVAVATGYLASRVRVVGAAGSELEQEVNRLRLEAADILRQIGSGVITVAGDGSLVFANWAAERLLAFVAAEYVGRPFMEYLNGVAPEIAIAIDATRGEGGRRLRVSGWISTPNEKLPIGVTTTLHQLGEESPSVTAIFTNISDQIRLQELNRRQERLEAVAELSASLAHEIKNPLASIRSSVEQLAKSVHADADDRFLSELVVRESDRLSRLLTEFLEFSLVRVAAAESVDLTVVARTAVAVAREHPDCAPGARVTVTGHCQPIPADEDLLHRVVLNLVLNALQAADGEAEVRVTIRNAETHDLPSAVSM
ncbi:MAG: histidine kinase dimerization/phospho-acceptor domain-containing protein, partial [Gemmatimonadales bacterium]